MAVIRAGCAAVQGLRLTSSFVDRIEVSSLRSAKMTSDAIVEFWKWWPSVAARIDDGIRNGGLPQELVGEISQRVASIDPSLDWELGPGRRARHHLCLSAKGDPVLRVVAERWLHHCKEDEFWEFYAARQAHTGPPLALKIAGQDVDFEQFMYSVEPNEDRELLDIGVYHPGFDSMEEDLRGRVTFIGLDNALGEDGVERWLGGVDILDAPPSEALTYADFIAATRELAENSTGDRWTVLRGEIDGSPIVVTTNLAIKRVDHLMLDQHVSIELALQSPTDQGFPDEQEAETLNQMEDQLFEALGEHAVNVGRETHAGRRTLHLHVMEGGPAASIVEGWRQRYPAYDVSVNVSSDPSWEVLDRWT